MKMASVTVKCLPETILPGTSSLHRGMGNVVGNFASRTFLATQVFFPSHLCVFFVPRAEFLQELLEPLGIVVPEMKKDKG